METADISYFSILTLFIILIPVLVINYYLKIKINKKLLYSIARMAIQLSLVGVFLQYIFNLNNPLLNIAYFFFMIIVAGLSIARSANLNVKKNIYIVILAFIIPNVLVLFYFNGLVVRLENIFEAQHLIPIGGMLLGNSLRGNIIALNNFYNSIKENEKEYFYSLSLSANKMEALLPYFKKALLTSVNPILASIETIGLVALPGMMTGQILGGSIPMEAIKYQIAIMIAIFIARYFSAILAILFTVKKSFDDYDMLIKD